ncbi:helix-turn-helix domain-containing protein [Streptomyces canus]|uniref:helix-turn-helix domain-containing protein n=1 Tax=Streptomyces canus TaxID=58343 RepID=UPI0032541EA6
MTRSPADSSPQHPFAHLAAHLKALRRAARLTQRALAGAAHISRGAVQHAESGTAPPTATVLDAYLHACGADDTDQRTARRLIVQGRTVQRGKLAELHKLKPPAPDFVSTKRELGLALVLAYERAGAPSLRNFDRPGRPRVPLATASRIVKLQALPTSREQLITFLTVCGIRPAAQRPYLDAYQHVIAQRGPRPVPPPVRHRQVTQRIVRRGHPIPLTHDGPDTSAPYDVDRMATAIRPVLDVLAADRARYDVDQLAAGIKPVFDVLAADPGIRNVPAAMATGLQVFTDAFAVMLRSLSREAHRNGTTTPDWVTETSLLTHGVAPARPDTVAVSRPADDHSIDLIAHTPDGGTQLFQAKNHQQWPGPPPAPVPPPPSAAPAARTA